MTREEQKLILNQGVKAWNKWREAHPDILPDLSGIDLSQQELSHINLNGAELNGSNLSGIDLSSASLMGAKLMGADLSYSKLQKADFMGAILIGTKLHKANLSYGKFNLADFSWADLTESIFIKANLMGATFAGTDLSRADLQGADLTAIRLIKTNLEQANLTGCTIYGFSSWGLNLTNTTQTKLHMTSIGEPVVMVNSVEIAQFIYLLLNNKKVKNAVTAVLSKFVLLLAFVSDQRENILDQLTNAIDDNGYIPIICDIAKPAQGDLTETIITLAHIARFVIIDMEQPKEIPQEAWLALNQLKVPVIVLHSAADDIKIKPYSEFQKHSLMLEVKYTLFNKLIDGFGKEIIEPAEKKAKKLNKQSLKALLE